MVSNPQQIEWHINSCTIVDQTLTAATRPNEPIDRCVMHLVIYFID